MSGIIVRKRSKESETTEDSKKSKIDEPKNADVIVSAEKSQTPSTNVSAEKSKAPSTNGLGALAGLGNYSSDSDNEDETT